MKPETLHALLIFFAGVLFGTSILLFFLDNVVIGAANTAFAALFIAIAVSQKKTNKDG